jgi:hypothetical protein
VLPRPRLPVRIIASAEHPFSAQFTRTVSLASSSSYLSSAGVLTDYKKTTGRRLISLRDLAKIHRTTPTGAADSMNQEIKRCLFLGAALVRWATADTPLPRITVLIHNYAAVPRDTVAIVEREVGAIFRANGVEIDWTDRASLPQAATGDPTCQVMRGPARFDVRLLSSSVSNRVHLKPGEFGRALLGNTGEFATVADVYADCLKELVIGREWAYGPILGQVIAHSTGGIMEPNWRPKDLDKILQRRMTFPRGQSEQIRAQVLARIAAASEACPP